MKSKSAAFSCSGCWFADLAGQFDEESWQIGCEADRDALFTDPITNRTDFKDFPKYRSLDRFCNMYRGIDWAMDRGEQDNINLHNDEYMLELARKEIKPSFGVVIFTNEESTEAQVRETLDSIIKAQELYDKKRVGTMISWLPNFSLGVTLNVVNQYYEKLRLRGITHAYQDSTLATSQLREKEAFTLFSKVSYYIKIKAGDTIQERTFKDVDATINDYMEKILVFHYGDAYILDGPLVRTTYLQFGQDYNFMQEELIKKAKQEGFYTEV